MSEESAPAQRLRDLRDKLCSLLEESDLYNARHVLERIGATELWDEQVVLHSKVRPCADRWCMCSSCFKLQKSNLQEERGMRWCV